MFGESMVLATKSDHTGFTRRALFAGTGALLFAGATRDRARTADWGVVDAAAKALIDQGCSVLLIEA